MSHRKALSTENPGERRGSKTYSARALWPIYSGLRQPGYLERKKEQLYQVALCVCAC